MSKLEDSVKQLVKKAFPSYRVKLQHYVIYQNTKLFFDILIPELKVVIEVQGQQHFSFTKFYHDSDEDFKSQKFRDKLKTQWAADKGYVLIAIDGAIVPGMGIEEFKQFVLARI